MTDDLAGDVRLERGADGVARIVLDRPHKRNALSTHMLGRLGERLDEVAVDPDIRVVTVHGAGTVFCAGADTREFADVTPEVIRGNWTRLGQRVFAALADLPQTTVAVLSGSAFGGGLELAMHCDFRIAADAVQLGLPEATLGTTPGWSGLGRVVELAGIGAARRLALTGTPVTATEAFRLGLIDVLTDEINNATKQLVDSLLQTTPIAQSILKRALTPHSQANLIDSLAGAYLATYGETNQARKTS